MNKRQAKKLFKKKYGMAPKQAAKSIRATVEEAQRIDWGKISKNMSQAMENAREVISNVSQKMVDWVKGISENIVNMPAEEYERLLKSDEMSREAKAFMMLIRQQSLKHSMEVQDAEVEKFSEVNRSN